MWSLNEPGRRRQLFVKAVDTLWLWPEPETGPSISNLSSREVNQFLTNLAVERNVAASTQTQALSALLFLYRHVNSATNSRSVIPNSWQSKRSWTTSIRCSG